MGKTSIAWTDFSYQVSYGCSAVSPGCAKCYAANLVATRLSKAKKYAGLATYDEKGQVGKWTGEIRHHQSDLLGLAQNHRKLRGKKVFLNSMSDTFHEKIPDGFLDMLFAVMMLTPDVTYQVLTKRDGRARSYLQNARERIGVTAFANALRGLGTVDAEKIRHAADRPWPLPNVWIGVSCESGEYGYRIDSLRETPAAVRFVSCEPLLGPLMGGISFAGVDQVIFGGESGRNPAPCRLDWIRNGIDQCRFHNVPAFVKQLGSFPIAENSDIHMRPSFARRTLGITHPKGEDPAEWPEDLRIQEWPDGHGPTGL